MSDEPRCSISLQSKYFNCCRQPTVSVHRERVSGYPLYRAFHDNRRFIRFGTDACRNLTDNALKTCRLLSLPFLTCYLTVQCDRRCTFGFQWNLVELLSHSSVRIQITVVKRIMVQILEQLLHVYCLSEH